MILFSTLDISLELDYHKIFQFSDSNFLLHISIKDTELHC